MAKKTNIEVNNQKYYRVRAKVGVDPDGKNIIKAFYGSSKKEAEQKRDEYLEGIKRGLDSGYDKITFGDEFEQWFEVVLRPTIAKSSYNRYEIQHRLHIKPADFYNDILINVKSINIQKHLNSLKSRHTALRVYMLLSSFYKYCISKRLFNYNIMISVKRPVHKKKDKKEVLTTEDRDVLFKNYKKDPNLFVYIFALFTGLRQGEIMALAHKDIDLDSNTIRVNKSLNRTKIDGKNAILISKPKTEESIRTVPLPENLVPDIKKHMNKEKEKHLRLKIPFSKDTFLFTSSLCTALRGDRLNSRWKDFQKEAGIDPITFHGLRHSFCTLLAEKGVPLKTASVLMGHSDIRTTAKIYTHINESQKQKAVEKLNILIK